MLTKLKMEITTRILLLLAGLFLSMLGVLSVVCAIAMVAISVSGMTSDINHTGGRILFEIFIFIIGEIFLAFGVAAWLLGLRCIFGSRGWIDKVINFTWKRSMRFTFVMGYLLIPLILILLFVRLFRAFM